MSNTTILMSIVTRLASIEQVNKPIALWSGPLGKCVEIFGIIAIIGRKTSRI